LAHRHSRDDVIDQVGGGLDHAPRPHEEQMPRRLHENATSFRARTQHNAAAETRELRCRIRERGAARASRRTGKLTKADLTHLRLIATQSYYCLEDAVDSSSSSECYGNTYNCTDHLRVPAVHVER
jgi:hypothetical protein